MTSKTSNEVSPEVRARAVRMRYRDYRRPPRQMLTLVIQHQGKIGSTSQTLNEWVKRAERDSGHKFGLTSDMAAGLKALER